MRARASAALHIGGFTNVQLEHPVLDAGPDLDDAAAERVLVFFLASALLHGAGVARVHGGRGERGRTLASVAKRALRGAILRVDDDNVALLRYFDVYLRPVAEVDARAGARVATAVQRALESS